MIEVHLGDMYAAVLAPKVPLEVRKSLTYWKRDLRQDQYGQLKPSGRTIEVYELTVRADGNGRVLEYLVTLPGFASRLYSVLDQHLIPFTVKDKRSVKPDFDAVVACAKLREYQYECALVAGSSNGGVIACPTGWGKTHMMGALIRGRNKEQMISAGTPLTVVVTPGQDLAEKNWRDLVDILPDREVGLVHGGKKMFSDDVQVVTPESTNHIEMDQAGLMIYDEVHTLTDKRIIGISGAEHAIRYGLSATPTGRFDGGDIMIEGMFGPIVYKRTYQQAIEDGAVVPITVVWLPLPQPNSWPPGGYKSKDAAYRRGLWRNETFHARVGYVLDLVPEDWQTLIVVDKTEHMDHMLEHLGEITYVHGDANKKSCEGKGFKHVKAVSKRERQKIYSRVEKKEITRVVSTGIYRVGVNFPELQLLVNAEGMGSDIIAGQLPGRASRNIDGKDMAYMVDFYAPWDIKAQEGSLNPKPGFIARDARSREEVYKELGFEQIWLEDCSGLKSILGV